MDKINKKMNLGRDGENFACEYLESCGYKILGRNWRKRFGEIDIIAQEKNKTLVFVEVKTMGYWVEGIQPEDQITREKMQKFKKTVEAYIQIHEKLIDEKRGWRCDVIAVTKIGNNFHIRHYENV